MISWIEKVYLPVYKVAGAPFHIQFTVNRKFQHYNTTFFVLLGIQYFLVELQGKKLNSYSFNQVHVALQIQNAVSAHVTSKQILHFDFAEQYSRFHFSSKQENAKKKWEINLPDRHNVWFNMYKLSTFHLLDIVIREWATI